MATLTGSSRSSMDPLGLELPYAERPDTEQPPAGELWPRPPGESPFAEAEGAGWTEAEALVPTNESFEATEGSYESGFDTFDEQEGEQNGFAAETLEALIASEAGSSGPASNLAGAASFVLGPPLRRGSTGAGVAMLQRLLIRLGGNVTADGFFGSGTEQALRDFQSRSGLPADGVAGPRTKAALVAAAARSQGPAPQRPVPSSPGQAPRSSGGRLVIDRHLLLRDHRGTPPDLIMRWSGISTSGEIDVVVHFHGYSSRREAMRIDRDKEVWSGLDFADPANPATAGRTEPTLALLPRGNYFGGQSGAGYNFPALVQPGALQRLIDDALARLGRETGLTLRMGRLILTGHSGGGAPVTTIVTHLDPDEVYIFDGTYGSTTNVARWAERRITREVASPTARPPAMRLLYRPGTQTQAQAQAATKALCRALSAPGAERLQKRFRADSTPVGHNEIPRRFGWRLLADPGADLPDAKTYACCGFHAARPQPEQEASPFWQAPANEREASEQERLEPAFLSLASPGAGHLESADARWSEEPAGESLAWLDFESESTALESAADEDEWESAEAEAHGNQGWTAGESMEAFADALDEAFDAPTGRHEVERFHDLVALEALLESEAGSGTGLADHLKGVAAFVVGPDLRRGSSGAAVATLQRLLARLGADLAVDGSFGPNTERAVKAFQARSGLTADGIVSGSTKAAIAAAVGRSALPRPSPGPSPVPSPVPSAADFGQTIARIAEEEYRRWHPPSGPIRERDDAAVPILQQYYREAVGKTVTAAQLKDAGWQFKNSWSAVFVSWVMRKAGAGAAFAYHRGHWFYIAAARENRLKGNRSNPFWAYRATEVAPQVGDLICAERQNSGANYDNIAQGKFSHSDIVTEVHPGWLRVIGGNVRQNVDAKKIRTLPDGRLALDGDQKKFFAVVRCRGEIGHPVTPRPPTPPAPDRQPPGPAPAPVGTKLSPAQFVAAYGAAARASQAKSGVPALVTLGQAALESGWGAHAPRFNFFGIKAKASDPEHTRQLLKTREVFRDPNRKFPEVISVTPRPDGRYDYVVRDWFRAYPDATTAFMAHGEFLVRNKRYSKAFQVAHDPYAFAAEVARAGYATDPSYERVLKDVMRKIETAGGFARESSYEGEDFGGFGAAQEQEEPLNFAWESSWPAVP